MEIRHLVPSCALAIACSAPATRPTPTPTVEAPSEPSPQAPEPETTPEELDRVAKDARLEAGVVMAELARTCAEYYEGTQRLSEADGPEPWHAVGEETNPAGFPVEPSSHTFPGGPGFTFTSHPRPPRGGEKLAPEASSSNPSFHESAHGFYGAHLGAPTHMRYTVAVAHGGSGPTCTITGEADLDPSSPDLTTVSLVVSVDANLAAVVGRASVSYDYSPAKVPEPDAGAIERALTPTARGSVTPEHARAHVAEAEAIFVRLTEANLDYFESEQRWSDPDGSEPWHAADPMDPDRSEGLPIPWSEHTFIGGTSSTLTTHASTPSGGALHPTAVVASIGGVTSRYAFEEASLMRYSVATGPGRGADASVTFVASIDLDPSTPGALTLTRSLSVDPTTQEVVVSETSITHEGR